MSAPLSSPIALGALDLAALLCSRVCHDLISPVGAIVNGLEVLDVDKNEQASAKLQFCRLAFGAAGSAGAQIDLGDAEKVARGLLADDKTKIEWHLPRELLAKNRVKLLLNMLLIAVGCIPRGGTLKVEPFEPGKGFRITASGLNARLAEATAELVAGPSHPVDAHGIQPVYAGILARDCGLTLSAVAEAEAVLVTAR
jgi:histidine phosphotransferase ChpT